MFVNPNAPDDIAAREWRHDHQRAPTSASIHVTARERVAPAGLGRVAAPAAAPAAADAVAGNARSRTSRTPGPCRRRALRCGTCATLALKGPA